MVDRHGERSAELRRVDVRLWMQAELVAPLFSQCETNDPARMLEHEVDRLRRAFLGRDDQVAFVCYEFHKEFGQRGREARRMDLYAGFFAANSI